MIRKFFFKLFLFLAILYVPGYLAFIMMERAYQRQNMICDKPDWVHNIRGQHFDLAVLGSSRALNVVDVKLIDDSLGTKSVNIGTSGGFFAENYITLYQFLKNGNSAKKFALQVDGYNLKSTRGMNRVFNEQYYMHLMSDDTIGAVIREYTSELKFWCWRLVPVTRYMEYSFRYSFFKVFKGGYQCDGSINETEKGYEALPPLDSMGVHPPAEEIFDFGEREIGYLMKIVALCKQNNIPLILFTAPEHESILRLQKNKKEVDTFYEKIAFRHGLGFVSNIHFGEINNNENYFRDQTHVNEIGAQIFTKRLIPFIN